MQETEQCECCSNDFLAEEMIQDKWDYEWEGRFTVWLCKQCAIDLNA